MLSRLRKAGGNGDDALLSGIIEADETLLGGEGTPQGARRDRLGQYKDPPPYRQLSPPELAASIEGDLRVDWGDDRVFFFPTQRAQNPEDYPAHNPFGISLRVWKWHTDSHTTDAAKNLTTPWLCPNFAT